MRFWTAASSVGTDGRIYWFWLVVVNHHCRQLQTLTILYTAFSAITGPIDRPASAALDPGRTSPGRVSASGHRVWQAGTQPVLFPVDPPPVENDKDPWR